MFLKVNKIWTSDSCLSISYLSLLIIELCYRGVDCHLSVG